MKSKIRICLTFFLLTTIISISAQIANTSNTKNDSKKVGCISGDCQNGYGTFIWEDNRKYIGTFKNGLLEGEGTFIWANGAKYIGEFKNNTMNGFGKEYNEEGELIYEGNYVNYKFHGHGIFFNNKLKMNGNWVNGNLNGPRDQKTRPMTFTFLKKPLHGMK